MEVVYKFIYLRCIKNKQTMTTLKNQSGSKAVNICKNFGGFIALYVQIYQGEQQVLETKFFAFEKRAIKWGQTKLA